MIPYIVKHGIELLIHSQTSSVKPKQILSWYIDRWKTDCIDSFPN